jgi:hypothetical protein
MKLNPGKLGNSVGEIISNTTQTSLENVALETFSVHCLNIINNY